MDSAIVRLADMENPMKNMRRIGQLSVFFSLLTFMSACVVTEPHEGYWDREHARYYHEHAWHPCGHEDAYCR